MSEKPPRPQPGEKIIDHDDGDPYSCMAAGRAEERLQEALEQEVEACFPGPVQRLERLVRRDLASVKTALYDLWDRMRGRRGERAKAQWAAERLADLGEPAVLRYDQESAPPPV